MMRYVDKRGASCGVRLTQENAERLLKSLASRRIACELVIDGVVVAGVWPVRGKPWGWMFDAAALPER
jgi:hypothetical protein